MRSPHLALIAAAGVAAAAVPVVASAAKPAKPAPGQASKASVAYDLPDEVIQPEGIAATGKRFYTGSRTNGTIAVGDTRTGSTRVLSPAGVDGRTAALGLKVSGDVLWVAGGPTGKVFALDRTTGATKAVFTLTGEGEPFVNDVVVSGGFVYATDSQRPQLYRIARDAVDAGAAQDVAPFLPFAGTPLRYDTEELNLNGIEARGRYLLSVQSATGDLWRIDPRTKAVREVRVTGGPLTNGDGLLVDRGDLLVVQNAKRTIARLDLDAKLTSARVVERRQDPVLLFPTTIARSGNRFLLPNARFDVEPGTVDYTVGSIRR